MKTKQQRKDEAYADYQEISVPAWEAYEAIQGPALEAYDAIQIPAWEAYMAKCKEIDGEGK